MYRFIVLMILSSITMPVFSETRTVVTQTPYYNPYYAPQAYYGGDYVPQRMYRQRRYNSSMFSDINDLEKYAMNKNFSKENDRTRLERLEMLAFGTIQEGDYRTRYDNVRNAILSRPKQNYKTSLFRSISDYFNGQITGYTPSINQSNDSFYSSPYGVSSMTDYVSPWGHGTKINNYGISSGTGVKILD